MNFFDQNRSDIPENEKKVEAAACPFSNNEKEYPPGFEIEPVAKQIEILREYFPELKEANVNGRLAELPLPEGAEGYFVIPRWNNIAVSYEEAMRKLLAAIKQSNDKFLQCVDKLDEKHLRQNKQTAAMFDKIGDLQREFDCLIVAAQFGLRHRGKSVRQTQAEFLKNKDEFGLDVFSVGCMLLTHPGRFSDCNSLRIDCPGSEYANDEGNFDRVPGFYNCGQYRFRACHPIDDKDPDYNKEVKLFGSVTAFFQNEKDYR